ncbi:MAG: 2-oxoglutarate dehydrogenase complex dihydrolipoyllysine-residue succinyltransferase [Gammaproteobacteria bacterium]
MIVDIKVPQLAESVAEASLMSWHKKAGDTVSRGDNLIDIETDKVTLEVTAPNDGVLKEIVREDGSQVGSNEVIARIDTEAAGTAKPAADKPSGKSANEVESDDAQKQAGSKNVSDDKPDNTKLSPAVRRLLEENHLNADQIPAARDDGRLTKEDVLNYLKTHEQDKGTNKPTAGSDDKLATSAKPALPTADRPEERVPMTRLRKRAAERLLSAQHDNALLTTFNEVNMAPAMELRERYKELFEKTHNVKLGFMSIFTKAAIEALKRFPVVNASVDADDIVYHGYFDIGIAVSSPRGLVVPVVRDADQLSFAEVESTIRDLGTRARDNKLTMEDLTGGTFTITNGGIFGSLMSTPIINPPQSAILGMHKIQERPMAENGAVVIRPMMYIALSYDHRIIDGRDAVQFLVAVKDMVEDPARLLLEI